MPFFLSTINFLLKKQNNNRKKPLHICFLLLGLNFLVSDWKYISLKMLAYRVLKTCHVWSEQQPGLGSSSTLLSITVLGQVLEIILKHGSEKYLCTTILNSHIVLLCFPLTSTVCYFLEWVWVFDHKVLFYLHFFPAKCSLKHLTFPMKASWP